MSNETIVDYQEWIINWFVENAHISADELRANLESSYFSKGWIDSLKFMFFISDIEDRFDVEFSNEEFQDRAFASVKGLAEIIAGKRV